MSGGCVDGFGQVVQSHPSCIHGGWVGLEGQAFGPGRWLGGVRGGIWVRVVATIQRWQTGAKRRIRAGGGHRGLVLAVGSSGFAFGLAFGGLAGEVGTGVGLVTMLDDRGDV